MSLHLTGEAYRELLDEDIAWLQRLPPTLESRHIIELLRAERRLGALKKALDDEDDARAARGEAARP